MKKIDPGLRQQYLLRRSAALRLSLAEQAQGFKKPLALVDQVRAGAQWLYRHPVWPLGAALLLAVMFSKRTALLWGGRLLGVWSIYKQVHQVMGAKPKKRD